MRALQIALPSLVLLLTACGKQPAKITLEPTGARLFGRGQQFKLHANPLSKRSELLQEFACAWSSSDEKVATVAGKHNDATVTATGAGSATIRCAIGDISAEATVAVRLVGRVEVKPTQLDLVMLDEPQPAALQIQAFDDQGALLVGRAPSIRCQNEEIARGDARGQLWAVGPGETGCTVEVGDAKAIVATRVKDSRSAEFKPKAVKGDPMAEYEKEFARREKERKKAEEKAAAGAK
ncbi:MAG: Ig-like domain-containing protein [Anaeromyxobacteraceae bacterium]